MTKKEIVRQISEKLGMTQLKTKEIVQLTFNVHHDLIDGSLDVMECVRGLDSSLRRCFELITRLSEIVVARAQA